MLTEIQKQHQDILDQFKESVVLLQGIFTSSLFDQLAQKKEKDIFVLEGRPSLDAAKFSCKELLEREFIRSLVLSHQYG